jgi:hypothetical protein
VTESTNATHARQVRGVGGGAGSTISEDGPSENAPESDGLAGDLNAATSTAYGARTPWDNRTDAGPLGVEGREPEDGSLSGEGNDEPRCPGCSLLVINGFKPVNGTDAVLRTPDGRRKGGIATEDGDTGVDRPACAWPLTRRVEDASVEALSLSGNFSDEMSTGFTAGYVKSAKYGRLDFRQAVWTLGAPAQTRTSTVIKPGAAQFRCKRATYSRDTSCSWNLHVVLHLVNHQNYSTEGGTCLKRAAKSVNADFAGQRSYRQLPGPATVLSASLMITRV